MKRNFEVELPLLLDVFNKGEGQRYRLSGYICHRGTSVQEGHNFAVTVASNPASYTDFYVFNDEKVSKLGDSTTDNIVVTDGANAAHKSKEAHIAFYVHEGQFDKVGLSMQPISNHLMLSLLL